MSVGIYSSILLQLMLVIFLSFWVQRLSSKLLPFGIYRVVVAPGIVLHELSHALGCLITGAKIDSVQFFNEEGGHVLHQPPKLPILGPVLISMAPIMVGLVLWFVVCHYYPFDVSAHPLAYKYHYKIGSVLLKLMTIKSVMSFNFWLYMVLIFNLSIAIVPSRQDFKNCGLPLCLVLLLFVLLDHFNYAQYSWLTTLNVSCMFLVIYSLVFFTAVLVVHGVYGLIVDK